MLITTTERKKMNLNSKFICGGKSFYTETEAYNYAHKVYVDEKVILGIARVNETDEERMELIDSVMRQIQIDMENGEFSALTELLDNMPSKFLHGFLSEVE